MKRYITFLLLYSIFGVLYSGQASGQTLYNLQIIWRKVSPDIRGNAAATTYWGNCLTSGDINNDGYSDIVSYTDSVLPASVNGVKYKIYAFYGGNPMDTLPDKVIAVDSAGTHPRLILGDFNGDGYSDLAVTDLQGLDVYSTTGYGTLHVYYSGPTGLPDTYQQEVIGPWPYGGFGCSITTGDFNNDGYADLAVGSSAVNTDDGRVYIYYGSAAGLQTPAGTIMEGHDCPSYHEGFGEQVGSGGDVNNDGYEDLAVAAPGNSWSADCAGRVYLYYGGNPMDTIADAWTNGEGANQMLGVTGTGIVPCDSFGLYGSAWYSTDNYPYGFFSMENDGKVYMLEGGTVIDSMFDFSVTHPGSKDLLGEGIGFGGYHDNDKRGDYLAGAFRSDTNKGRAYLWLNRNAMNTEPDAYIIGRFSDTLSPDHGEWLGGRVTNAGDVNGDGRDEFMVSNSFCNLSDTSVFIWICKYTGPDGVTGEPEVKIQNSKFKIYQNTPNPFSQQTNLKYQIANPGRVTISIYNIAGQQVKTLCDEYKQPGTYNIIWNGTDNRNNNTAGGVYLCMYTHTGKETTTKTIKIIKLK